MNESNKTDKYRSRLKQMEADTSTLRTEWKELAEYIRPESGRYLQSDESTKQEGGKVHQKIINDTAGDAVDSLDAGMHGGLTSPSRPWFVLSIADKALMEYAPVRQWLHDVRDIMLSVLAKSNFYDSMHNVYTELGVFGTSAMLIEEDFDSVIRCVPYTIGEFYLGVDSKYRPNAMYRKFSLKAHQMAKEFGEDNVSQAVRDAFKNNNTKPSFEIVHVIEKNADYDMSKADARGMEFVSVYYEVNGPKDKVLRQSGYRMKPFIAPRWFVVGKDVYGQGRGKRSLGDVKQLQKMEEKKLKALDKMVDPPMVAPPSLRQRGGTIIAGGVNYVDVSQGQQGFAPAYQVKPDMQNIAFEIDRVERRIEAKFYKDLFLSITSQDKSMTATEIAERHTEKLQMLGPVIERLQNEALGPLIERTYQIMESFGIIPPAPQELEGMELKIEYISMLAQAQKIVGTTAIEQVAGFVGSLAGIYPEVRDKFDADEAVDEYADMVGLPPKIIVPDDKVAEKRAADAKAAQQAQMMEQMGGLAQGAKTLSETETGNNSVLDMLMQNPS